MTSQPIFEELDHRTADGVEVTLFWNRRTNGLMVAVFDAKTGDSFGVPVDAASALDAFHHPYTYAAPAEAGRTFPVRTGRR